jgi:predicted small lipoprotein YifL
MNKSIILLAAAASLAACGQSTGNSAANQAVNANAAAAKKPKPAYCFFKDSETKGWAAKRGKDENIVVTGKVYREDSRYKAVLNSPTVNGTTAEISPTITVNDTGYGAQDNWWDVKSTIPNSAAVNTVGVTCGEKTVAELKVATKR